MKRYIKNSNDGNIKYVQANDHISYDLFDTLINISSDKTKCRFSGNDGTSWVALASDDLDMWNTAEEADDFAEAHPWLGKYIYIYKIDATTRHILGCVYSYYFD